MRAPRGFTLIEVLVSLFVIGTVIALSGAILRAAPLSRHVKYQESALSIASNKIESLRALGYSALPVSGTFSDPLLSGLPSGSAVLTVSDYNDKTKQASVAVSWKEAGQTATSTVSLTTLITSGGGVK